MAPRVNCHQAPTAAASPSTSVPTAAVGAAPQPTAMAMADSTRAAVPNRPTPPRLQLQPPCLTTACMGPTIACVRSMRSGGPLIGSDRQGDKLVSTAIGLGGSGYTLAPGVKNALMALFDAQLLAHPEFCQQDVAVVGGGLMGLTMATVLAKHAAVERVHIYAEQREGLASDNAGGLLGPTAVGVQRLTDAPGLTEIACDAFRAWAKVADGNKTQKDGSLKPKVARRMPSYQPIGQGTMFAPYIAAGLMPPGTPVDVCFAAEGPIWHMERFETLFIDVTAHMARLHRRASRRGVAWHAQKVTCLTDLSQPLIFNCAGLGGGELAHDSNMVPVLGHMIELRNQPNFFGQQYMLSMQLDSDTEAPDILYYIPKVGADRQGVVGGTFFLGEADLAAHLQAPAAILQRARAVLAPATPR